MKPLTNPLGLNRIYITLKFTFAITPIAAGGG